MGLPITNSELAEAHRVLAIVPVSDVPPEAYTCFDCPGHKPIAECSEVERAAWSHLRKFSPEAKTICSLAWDPYNVDGDCLASK